MRQLQTYSANRVYLKRMTFSSEQGECGVTGRKKEGIGMQDNWMDMINWIAEI